MEGILPTFFKGFVDLRLTEAFRLKWDSVDLDSGIVTIQGQVKGRMALRRIPIPELVMVIHDDAERSGDRVLAPYSEHGNHAKAVALRLRSWKAGLQLEPKGLRRTLESEAPAHGWEGYAFNRYLARVPGSIAARHYIAVGSKLVGAPDRPDRRGPEARSCGMD